jgi:hypothetical protein
MHQVGATGNTSMNESVRNVGVFVSTRHKFVQLIANEVSDLSFHASVSDVIVK